MTTSPVKIGVSFDGFVTTGEAIALAQRAVEDCPVLAIALRRTQLKK